MPATVRIWVLFGPQAFGIGHSSLGIDGLYITWLGDGSGWSQSSDSSSVSQSSRSSSLMSGRATVINGRWNFENDKKQFKGNPAQTRDIPVVGDDPTVVFGLRAGALLRAWWATARRSIGAYKGVSIDRNCNAVVALGMRAANAELYAPRPAFSTFAGTNRVITFAAEVTRRADLLNRLWARQLRVLAAAPVPAAAVVPLANAFPAVLPRVTVTLAQYHGAPNCRRDQLKALADTLDVTLTYIENRDAERAARRREADLDPVVPSAPSSVSARIVPLSAVPVAPRREGFVVVDPYDAIKTFATHVARRMTEIEDDAMNDALQHT